MFKFLRAIYNDLHCHRCSVQGPTLHRIMRSLVCVVFCLGLAQAAPTAKGNDAWTPQDYLDTLTVDDSKNHFFADPTDCRKYYNAFWQGGRWRSLGSQCGEGTVWNQKSLTCLTGTCGSDKGICADKNGDLLPDEKNCANFYHCSHGEAHLKCCPAGLGWNDTSKTCSEVKSCTVKAECGAVDPAVTTTEGPEPESCIRGVYIYIKIEGKIGKYTMKHVDTGIVEGGERTCPVGQHFNTREIHCGCYDPDQTFLDKAGETCNKLTFTDGYGSSRLYVSAEGTGVQLKGGKVCFADAASYLSVPFYNNAQLGENLEISFPCEDTSAEGFYITNHKTLGDATVAIYLEKEMLKVKITTDEGVFIVSHKAAIGKVVVKFGNGKLVLIVAGLETSVIAKGKIKVTQSDLFIGKGFVGCIDEIDICRPFFTPKTLPASDA